jgi:acetylornithine deacetylase/succinyl-diaminopimelate desuccinylase-like protein
MTTYKNLLTQFIQFRSVSTDSQFAPHIEGTVAWLSESFQKNNFSVERLENYGNPIILASYIHEPQAPTCLIYGHYDVQPAQIQDGWNTEPFEVHEDEKRIYARGAVDNKGQVLVHIATIFDLIKEKSLQYNIKFFIEGNEETGSPFIGKCITENLDKLKCDFVLISDGEISGKHPIIELGFRGGANTTLTLHTASNDLHSGIYGGIAPNAALEMTQFLAKLVDTNNKVTIPHFYENVDQITEEPLDFNREEFEKITGAKTLKNEPEIHPSLQTGLRPSVQITGIQSGYTGEGYRNGIPSKAVAKINFRLVKSQDPQKIMEQFKEYINSQLPNYITWSLDITDPYQGIKLNINSQIVQKAGKILAESFNKEVLHKYSGGGLPIVTLFNDLLNIPQVLVPLGNEDCNMHGVNENFDKDILQKALTFSRNFFSKN